MQPACALEYRSTGQPAVLYDAPSTASGKIAIAGSGLPLEVVVDTDAWTKVRDHSGRLASFLGFYFVAHIRLRGRF